MIMDEDEIVGCTAPRKKLDEDLKSGAGKDIIDQDVEVLKKCLQEPSDDK